ncbi:aminotransferase class III-fold pyridoxal phosphate-dependent enzyme [Paraburkholderia oxyphila]|uniref:aminotransferase class III-fold pyridoxal phosphate-dependent enzyme n=1 Tax=Paraburkholderia oxyphila TaxID=614212 RepID=UPI000AEEFFC1
MFSNQSVDRSAIAADNARYIWHPMAAPAATEAALPTIITQGEGVFVQDIDGKRYLDCTAGLWCVNVGHGRPEIKQAIVDQLDQIAYYGTFSNLSNPPSIALSARLIKMLAPEKMARVMYGSGGSDANETAFKLARQYWKLSGKPEKTKIFSLKHGYHGLHFGGMSAGGNIMWRRAYEPMLPGFFQAEAPYLYRNPWTDDPERLVDLCIDDLEREILHQGADTVAAFVAEPVQGAGGLIVPPARYWPRLRELCDRHDVLLIADEVVTGFGRTGSMFGARAWGVAPDIMNFAKGINSAYVPLGATVVNERVARAWDTDHPLATIMHGYTYSGHPLACAAALANLDIVEREDLPGNAARQGEYFLARLRELLDYKQVGEVRGKGLMLGIELVLDKATKAPLPPTHPASKKLYATLCAQGLLVRIAGNKIILSPPLTFEKEHVERCMNGLHAAFEAIAAD